MPTAVSSDLKECIVQWYLEDTYTMQDISTLAHVSIGLVSKTISLHHEFGQVVNPEGDDSYSRTRTAFIGSLRVPKPATGPSPGVDGRIGPNPSSEHEKVEPQSQEDRK
ncbi:hypothetical protein C8R44DRAFT_746145 [Mycena epipterygia]|nr:hypothetical protein C8R44DRAFT_746145 [Mycena epipterygia]